MKYKIHFASTKIIFLAVTQNPNVLSKPNIPKNRHEVKRVPKSMRVFIHIVLSVIFIKSWRTLIKMFSCSYGWICMLPVKELTCFKILLKWYTGTHQEGDIWISKMIFEDSLWQNQKQEAFKYAYRLQYDGLREINPRDNPRDILQSP